MTEFVEATGYVVIEATVRSTGKVVNAKLERATQRPPFLSGPQVAVYLKIRLPESVFNAAVAAVTVEVPEELVQTPGVSVEAASE